MRTGMIIHSATIPAVLVVIAMAFTLIMATAWYARASHPGDEFPPAGTDTTTWLLLALLLLSAVSFGALIMYLMLQ